MTTTNVQSVTNETERVLKQRALELARRRHVEKIEVAERILIVRRGTMRFGLPTSAIQEVREVEVVPLPAAPALTPAIFQLRGQAITLVDLLAAFGEADSDPASDTTRMVAIAAGRSGVWGLVIDQLEEPRNVADGELRPVVDESGRGVDFVRALTSDLVNVLDIERIEATLEAAAEVSARPSEPMEES